MLNRAEFGAGDKVHHWDGEKYKKAVVISATLNPITNIVEYVLFFRKENRHGRKVRVYKKGVLPYEIKESKHAKEYTC